MDYSFSFSLFIAPIFDLILALIWFIFLDVFMTNLDENGSNLLSLTHIVLITYFVLLSGETLSFDRKEDFRSSFKKDWKSNKDPKNGRIQGGASHGQWAGPCTARRTVMHLPRPARLRDFRLFNYTNCRRFD